MKKILTFVGIAVSSLMFSQASRFVYQVTMKPNSDDKKDIKTENVYLDITPEKSVFVAENRVKRDSLMDRMRTTGNFNREAMQDLRSNIEYTVEKDFKTQKSTFKQRIGRDIYSYEEDRTFDWKILPETVTIGNYKAQKATTNFAGRTWNAWFTTEVPFQDGPYKFSGLPGLIVKLEDETGDYSFDLKETKKIAEAARLQDRGNVVKVKRTDFDKQQAKFTKDPMSFFNIGGPGAPPPPPSASGSPSGPRMRMGNDPQRMKEMETRIKAEIAKNNNPIELPEKK